MGTSLKEKVLRVVSNSRVPLSTREIAEMLGNQLKRCTRPAWSWKRRVN